MNNVKSHMIEEVIDNFAYYLPEILKDYETNSFKITYFGR